MTIERWRNTSLLCLGIASWHGVLVKRDMLGHEIISTLELTSQYSTNSTQRWRQTRYQQVVSPWQGSRGLWFGDAGRVLFGWHKRPSGAAGSPSSASNSS